MGIQDKALMDSDSHGTTLGPDLATTKVCSPDAAQRNPGTGAMIEAFSRISPRYIWATCSGSFHPGAYSRTTALKVVLLDSDPVNQYGIIAVSLC